MPLVHYPVQSEQDDEQEVSAIPYKEASQNTHTR